MIQRMRKGLLSEVCYVLVLAVGWVWLAIDRAGRWLVYDGHRILYRVQSWAESHVDWEEEAVE